jgi:Cu/Ag efflux protein CusF
MHVRIALAVSLFIALPVTAPAQQPVADTGVVTNSAPGKVSETSTVKVTATVTALDKANRAVTLKGQGGYEMTMIATDEVKNFDQIRVGDKVVVHYTQALALELKKGGGEIPKRVESEGASRAGPDEKPASVVKRQVTVVADVTAVDMKNQMVTLRGPKKTVKLKVEDPEQLKLIKKGDQIEATYSEALAASIEPSAHTK